MKNIFALIIIILAIGSVSELTAQDRYFDERYIHTHAFLNPVLINPGATAFHDGHQLLVNYRNKFSSFDGAPTTITMSYDGILLDRLGIGAIFLQDNFGSLRTSKGQLSLSYGIKSDVNNIRFGLSTEYISHGLNNNSNGVDNNDPLINLKREGASYLDVSFGAFGKYQDKFTYGLVLPSLISSRLDDNIVGDEDRDLGFITHLAYNIKSSNGINIEPSVIIKKLNNVPTHVELNARLGFLEEKFTSGVSYTVGAENRLGFLLGFAIDKLNFFYTYNTAMKDFQTYNNGSHELSVRLNLSGGKIKAVEKAEMIE